MYPNFMMTVVQHQQNSPPLYRPYTDLYRVTDSTERYLPLQSSRGLYKPIILTLVLYSGGLIACTYTVQSLPRKPHRLHRNVKPCMILHRISYYYKQMVRIKQCNKRSALILIENYAKIILVTDNHIAIIKQGTAQ